MWVADGSHGGVISRGRSLELCQLLLEGMELGSMAPCGRGGGGGVGIPGGAASHSEEALGCRPSSAASCSDKALLFS